MIVNNRNQRPQPDSTLTVSGDLGAVQLIMETRIKGKERNCHAGLPKEGDKRRNRIYEMSVTSRLTEGTRHSNAPFVFACNLCTLSKRMQTLRSTIYECVQQITNDYVPRTIETSDTVSPAMFQARIAAAAGNLSGTMTMWVQFQSAPNNLSASERFVPPSGCE